MSDTKAHALASPSHSHTWLACANSLAAQRNQPEGDKTCANLGSAKHELLATCLRSGDSPDVFLGQQILGSEIDYSFVKDVEYVRANISNRKAGYEKSGGKADMFMEVSLDISGITGEMLAHGSADCIILSPVRNGFKLDIIDAKFGYRRVNAKMNPQLMLYAAAALKQFNLVCDIRTVDLIIEQPAHGQDVWSVTPEELSKWAAEIVRPAAEKALAIYRSDKPLNPSDFSVSEKGCQWCRAKPVCPAHMRYIEGVIQADMKTLGPPEGNDLSLIPIHELGEVYKHLDTIESWAEAVRQRVTLEMLNGTTIPGLALVPGRKAREQWLYSEPEIVFLLKKMRMTNADIYKYKLASPTAVLQAAKGCGKLTAKIRDLVTQPEGKMRVVAQENVV